MYTYHVILPVHLLPIYLLSVHAPVIFNILFVNTIDDVKRILNTNANTHTHTQACLNIYIYICVVFAAFKWIV